MIDIDDLKGRIIVLRGWLKVAMQDVDFCPECHEHEADGHAADCELAKALVSEQSEEELADD